MHTQRRKQADCEFSDENKAIKFSQHLLWNFQLESEYVESVEHSYKKYITARRNYLW